MLKSLRIFFALAIVIFGTSGICTRPVFAETALKSFDQQSLESVVKSTAKELLVPGAVVLLRTPQGKFTVNYGTTKLGKNNLPSAQTHFRIASNTKTMTSAIILQLAQEGKLRLSDPISKYVSAVPHGDKIKLSDLLEMRSGLYGYTDSPELSASIDKNPTKVWSPQEVLEIAFKHKPNAKPGTVFEYNNTNYALLGLVTEKVDGKPLATAMQERLFSPLNMSNTNLPLSTSNEIPELSSHGYLFGSSSVALVGSPPYSEKLKAAARARIIYPKDYTNVNHSFAAAAGGVISNADDLATWIEALCNGRVLNAQTQQVWLNSIQPEDPKAPRGRQYGYGIAHMQWGDNAFYFHGGETPGFNSFMGYDPKNKVTLIVWTNLTVSMDQLPTANSLMLKVLDLIYSQSPIPPQG